MVQNINVAITWSRKRLSSGAISLLEKNCSKNGQSGRLYLHILILSNDDDDDNNIYIIIISQIYCNYIYTSKELYDMENREASDLAAVRAEKE